MNCSRYRLARTVDLDDTPVTATEIGRMHIQGSLSLQRPHRLRSRSVIAELSPRPASRFVNDENSASATAVLPESSH